MKTILLIITACFTWLAAAAGAPYYITAPLSGATWMANSTAVISWNEGANETVTINLIQGDSSVSMIPTGHYFTANGASGSTFWKVPASLDTNATYAIRIDYTDQSTGQVASAYSGAFKVMNRNTDVTSTTKSVSAATTSIHALSSAGPKATPSPAHSSMSSHVPSSSLPPNLRPSLAASTTPDAFMSGANTRYAMIAATSVIVPFIVSGTLMV